MAIGVSLSFAVDCGLHSGHIDGGSSVRQLLLVYVLGVDYERYMELPYVQTKVRYHGLSIKTEKRECIVCLIQ